MQNIYETAKEQFLNNLEDSNKLLTAYEMFDLFMDYLTEDKKRSFLEDIKEKMSLDGYIIFKPNNLLEEMKLREFNELLYPNINEQIYIF